MNFYAADCKSITEIAKIELEAPYVILIYRFFFIASRFHVIMKKKSNAWVVSYKILQLQIPIHEDADLGGMELADELLRLANSHNEKLDNCNKSLCDLLKMPAAPYGEIGIFHSGN